MLEPVELVIERLGGHGDGIARVTSGASVFVPLTLPGERVQATVDGERADVTEILSPSPDRVAPACRHFGICGGCALQHMAPAAYLNWKRGLVAAAFAAAGLPCPELTMVQPEGGRRRAVFAARSGPSRPGLGFHRAGSHDLVDISECPVLEPAIVAALPTLRRLAELVAPRNSGFRIIVLSTPSGLDVAVQGGAEKLAPENAQLVSTLLTAGNILRLSLDGDVVLSRGTPTVRCGPADVTPAPGVFLQAVAAAEQKLAEIVVRAAVRSKAIADLFCGLGAFAFPLAAQGTVFAADSDKLAIDALASAAKRTPGIKAINARVRDLFREPLAPRELDAYDCVVFDPPRAGAEAQARALARSKVPTVVAVSCNPQTLARDVRILVDGGYAINHVTAIDQFRYTAHVEAVAVLKRPSQAAARRRST